MVSIGTEQCRRTVAHWCLYFILVSALQPWLLPVGLLAMRKQVVCHPWLLDSLLWGPSRPGCLPAVSGSQECVGFPSYIWDLGRNYGDEILQLGEIYACRVNRRSQVLSEPSLPGQCLGFRSRGVIQSEMGLLWCVPDPRLQLPFLGCTQVAKAAEACVVDLVPKCSHSP